MVSKPVKRSADVRSRQRAGSAKNFRVIIALLLVINLTIRLYIAFRPINIIDDLTFPDDSYLSLTIARNIAHGLGPIYGTHYTNGFQPMYVFLMAPVYWLFPNNLETPIHIALVLLTLFDTLALFVLVRFIDSFSASRWTSVTIAAAWVFNPYVITTTLNGLETMVSFFFIVAALKYFFDHDPGPNREGNGKHAVILGALLGLALFARIDNICLVFGIIAVLLFRWFKEKITFPDAARTLLLIFSGIAVMYLPWLLYSYHYTGGLYPVSGKAVRNISLSLVNYHPTFDNWYASIYKKVGEIVNNYQWVFWWPLAGLLLLLPFVKGKTGARLSPKLMTAFFAIALFSASLLGLYMFYIFTPWFFDRYLFNLILLFMAGTTILTDYYLSRFRSRFAKGLFLFLLVGFAVGANVSQNGFSNLFFSEDTHKHGYRNLGLWASTHFKDGTIIGGSQTGALGYYATNLKVINLDGVVNQECFEALEKRQNLEYIRSQHIEYILDWLLNLQFIETESANLKKGDLTEVGAINEFLSWNIRWHVFKVNYPR